MLTRTKGQGWVTCLALVVANEIFFFLLIVNDFALAEKQS